MTNKKRIKVVFIHTVFSTFVENDFNILSSKFYVKKYQYKVSKSLYINFKEQIKLLFWLLNNIWFAKATVIWFGDYHSLLPILFSKILSIKSFLILGGYDVAVIPELNYGSFYSPLRSFFTYNSIKFANCNLAVSEFLMEEAKARISNANVKVLYTGHSETKFYPGNQLKQNIVLTVGAGNNLERIRIKGIDFFLKIARVLTQYKFVLIGTGDHVKKELGFLPANVKIEGRVEDDILLKYYQQAKVYAQFSLREGLPSAVCEAMLCECVVVGSNNGGIPIALGECGFILEDYDVEKASKLVVEAMNADSGLGKKARKRVIQNFSHSKRETELTNLIINSI